jgi:hypothetical protein
MSTMGHALQVLTITAHGSLQESGVFVKFARFGLVTRASFERVGQLTQVLSEVQNHNQNDPQGTEKRIQGSVQVVHALVHLIGVASLYIASVEVTEK